jgi:hypothetical protein
MSARNLIVALFLFSSAAIADKPVWDKWQLDNAFDRDGDWLVVADPLGSCYMVQSYGASAPELIIRSDDSVNLKGAGKYESITYQVDIGNVFTVRDTGTRSIGYVALPDADIKTLKVSSSLTVTIDNRTGQTRQVYSLEGFTKAYDAVKRCKLANDPPLVGR